MPSKFHLEVLKRSNQFPFWCKTSLNFRPKADVQTYAPFSYIPYAPKNMAVWGFPSALARDTFQSLEHAMPWSLK